MKKITLVFLFFSLSFNVIAQKVSCKTEYDEFTKMKTQKTQWVQIGSNKKSLLVTCFLESMLSHSENGYSFFLSAEYRSAQSIDEATEIILLFSDKSTMKLTFNGFNVSSTKYGKPFVQGDRNILFYNTISFELSKEQVDDLQQKSVEKIRVGVYDYNLKGASFFKNAINCIEETSVK